MTAALLLQLGLVVAALVLIVLFLAVASVMVGLVVSIATLPLLYLTGYGFVPLQWSPAYGTSYRKSVVRHTVIGTIVFGLATTGGILRSGLRSGGVPLPGVGTVSGRLLITAVILAVAFASSVLASAKGGVLTRERATQQVLPLIGVWFGYPVALYGVSLLLELVLGSGSL